MSSSPTKKQIQKQTKLHKELSHFKALEMLESAKKLDKVTQGKKKWFVEIRAVDKITGEIVPLKVLL